MAINRERLARLAEFGFKTHAARAYLALLGLGEAQAGDISAASQVPTSKLYAVLTKLETRGLVEVVPDFPRRYRAIPFEAFVDSEIRAQRANLERLEAAREAFAREFAVEPTVLGTADAFTLLKGRRALSVRLDEVLTKAHDVFLVAGSASFAWLSRRRGLLAARLEAGARVRILASAQTPLPGELRVGTPEVAVLLVILDRSTAFLCSFRKTSHGDEDEDPTLTVASPELVAGLRALAEAAWDAADGVRIVPAA